MFLLFLYSLFLLEELFDFFEKSLTIFIFVDIIFDVYGELAQLARASALHAGGQGFESLILHHYREVAQLGRAFGLGPRGCRFKSCLPDHYIKITTRKSSFFVSNPWSQTKCPIQFTKNRPPAHLIHHHILPN